MSNNAPPLFPSGEYVAPGHYGPNEKMVLVSELRDCPTRVRDAIQGLTDEQLDTRYRNWSIRQIVHHLADSHMNAYIRFKWALTENSPRIKSYDETKWSEIVDARQAPIGPSLMLLDGLHARWAWLIENLTDEEMSSTFFHPELDDNVALHQSLPIYVWHTGHHVAQILWIRSAKEW